MRANFRTATLAADAQPPAAGVAVAGVTIIAAAARAAADRADRDRHGDGRRRLDHAIALRDVAHHRDLRHAHHVARHALDDRVVVLHDADVADFVFANDQMVGFLDAPPDFHFALRVDHPRLVHVLGGVD